jgi:hypothetical protein
MHFAAQDIRTLRRIVAVLVALAALADRAEARCFPVRLIVLWILTRAEIVVQAFLLDTTGLDWADDPAEVRGHPGEATMLALRLRMLAAALAALLRCECLADCRRIAGPLARPAMAGWRLATIVGPAPVPADTS